VPRHVTIAIAGLLWPLAGFLHAQSGTWQTLAAMPTARQELATAVLNGNVYTIGGYNIDGQTTNTVEIYNPNTNSWASAHPFPIRNNHHCAAVAAGRLYCFGGVSRRTFVYDSTTDSWSEVASLNFPHDATAAVGVYKDKIYVVGGFAGTTSSAELEVYDPVANTWTILAPMSIRRNHTGGAFINGKFYVAAGRGTAEAPTALEAYDPQTNGWIRLASMPTARSGVGVAAVNGELFVFGGEIPRVHGEVEAYNPVTNSWRQLPNMPVPRHGLWASVIGNRIYLPGGATEPNYAASSVNDVFVVNRKATFANISSRLKVETGENVLIGGFIVNGSATKRVIVRAIGASLPVAGALADPVVELYNGSGELVASNDNWQDAPNRQEIIDSTLAPSHPLESAVLTTVAPGNHTAVVRGANRGTGIGLVEVYDLEAGSESNLANISTRALVQTGDDVLIGGLIITGNDPRRVIVRAIGPSLPVASALADPTLELRNADGSVVATNDNWRSSQEAEINATTIPPPNNSESAIVQTLSPAHYTAIVRGVNGTTGVALVEAYALP
jgi:N-acetylneuraminic acid mutarotase